MVTRPFTFEGRRRANQAEDGIAELREEVDTLIVIPNDRLLSISDRQVSVLDAFKSADQVLLSGVQGITDLITTPGLINLDFADVKSVMSEAGSALMGIGSARGDDRAVAAAEMAISSPLLEASIDGARGVLLSISGGSDLASSRSTKRPSWSARPRTPRPTSSSARSSTTRSATRSGSPSSRRASTAASRRPSGTTSSARPPRAPSATSRRRPRPRPRVPPPNRPARPSAASAAVTSREEPATPEPAETSAPASEAPATPVTPPQVPPARPYQDSQAEELDVPDFLK